MSKTLIHLVRHAEVHNPSNVWYGRLEGFRLSEKGNRQAEALAHYFQGHPIQAVYSSPLQRAVETATAVAGKLGLQVVLEDGLLESSTKLEGKPGGWRVMRNPLNVRHFYNPVRPSWGESYRDIQARMGRAIEKIRAAHEGTEAIVVSHMTPILVARLAAEGNKTPAWRARIPCERASITTLAFRGARVESVNYQPIGSKVQ